MPTPPTDPTTTSAWQALSEHESTLRPDLRTWFADDPDRAQRLTLQVADLTVDLSKNLVTDETLALLARLADEVHLTDRFEAMLRGALKDSRRTLKQSGDYDTFKSLVNDFQMPRMKLKKQVKVSEKSEDDDKKSGRG